MDLAGIKAITVMKCLESMHWSAAFPLPRSVDTVVTSFAHHVVPILQGIDQAATGMVSWTRDMHGESAIGESRCSAILSRGLDSMSPTPYREDGRYPSCYQTSLSGSKLIQHRSMFIAATDQLPRFGREGKMSASLEVSSHGPMAFIGRQASSKVLVSRSVAPGELSDRAKANVMPRGSRQPSAV